MVAFVATIFFFAICVLFDDVRTLWRQFIRIFQNIYYLCIIAKVLPCSLQCVKADFVVAGIIAQRQCNIAKCFLLYRY